MLIGNRVHQSRLQPLWPLCSWKSLSVCNINFTWGFFSNTNVFPLFSKCQHATSPPGYAGRALSKWEHKLVIPLELRLFSGHCDYHSRTKDSITWMPNTILYYMANPVLGKSLCPDWFFLGQDFAVRTVSMETVQSVYFCFGAKPPNSMFATKTVKKCENCHSSRWNYQQKLKRLKFFRNFTDGWRRRTFFKCKPPEVHFTMRNRVPYNKLLTNRPCSGSTGEYWPPVVFVRTECSEVRPVTTSGQYSPVWPSSLVSKRLVISWQLSHVSL